MAKRSRPKYKAKNIHEYKRLRPCTHHSDCTELGIVSYRNDTEESVRVEYRCIPHIHDEKEPKAVAAAKQPNLYKTMRDIDELLSLASLHTGKV